MGGTEVSGHLTNSKPSLTATGVSAGTIFIKIIVHLLGTYISECMTCLKEREKGRRRPNEREHQKLPCTHGAGSRGPGETLSLTKETMGSQ